MIRAFFFVKAKVASWQLYLLCITVLSLPSTNASAWGIVGHRIVCEVAYDLIRPETRESVDSLTAAFSKPNGKTFKQFTDACHFADTARHNAREGFSRWTEYAKYDHWHYVNLPRNATKLTSEVVNCKQDCVLHAIEEHGAIFSNQEMPKSRRGEALILLAHWVADIHQPMHASFADDRGGSSIKLNDTLGYGRHLHSAWDAGIIKAHRGSRSLRRYLKTQTALAREEQELWQKDVAPITWAQESFDIVTSPGARYCQWREVKKHSGYPERRCEAIASAPLIDASYVSRIAPLLERRLRQAGVRLALMLDKRL